MTKLVQKSNDLKQRVITASVFAIIMLGLLAAGMYGQLLLLLIIGTFAAAEYLIMTGLSKIFAYCIPLIMILLISSATSHSSFQHINILIFLSLSISAFAIVSMKIDSWRTLHSKIGFFYAFGAFALPISLLMSFLVKNYQNSNFLIFIIILLIWSNDSFAYFSGRALGSKKLAPTISPNKTVEGFIGGGILTLLLSLFMSLFFSTPWSQLLIMAAVVWLFGSIGDLVQSSIKRYFKVKDSGTLLPGHGGFWDRFDSFIFVLIFILSFQIYII